MTPEQEVLTDLLARLERIGRGADDDRQLPGEPPASVEAFEDMPAIARTASKALLKGFEQYADTLQRVIRTELRLTGHRLKGMTPLDVGNKAEELGQVSDATVFLTIVKLRDELVHEYPDDAETRFHRFSAALAALPFLHDAAARVRRFADTRMTGSSA